MEQSQLAAIFSFGERYGEQLASELVRVQMCVDFPAVIVSPVHLPLPPDDWVARAQFTGSGAHQRLCHAAACWLERQGKQWTAEQAHAAYGGGIADVISSDRAIAIECGYTTVAKVLLALANAMSVLIVPYDDDDLAGYLFQPCNLPYLERITRRPDRWSRVIARRILAGEAPPIPSNAMTTAWTSTMSQLAWSYSSSSRWVAYVYANQAGQYRAMLGQQLDGPLSGQWHMGCELWATREEAQIWCEGILRTMTTDDATAEEPGGTILL